MFAVESDLALLNALQEGQLNTIKDKKETALALHVRELKGPLRNHPGAPYFLWSIKSYCLTSGLAGTNQLLELLADVPDERPLPPRIYWSQPAEY